MFRRHQKQRFIMCPECRAGRECPCKPQCQKRPEDRWQAAKEGWVEQQRDTDDAVPGRKVK